jgi:hypothetical protein
MEAFALGRGDAYGLLPRPGSQGTYSLHAAYVVRSASRPRISAPTQADGPSIGSIDETRWPVHRNIPDLVRIVVAIDPRPN